MWLLLKPLCNHCNETIICARFDKLYYVLFNLTQLCEIMRPLRYGYYQICCDFNFIRKVPQPARAAVNSFVNFVRPSELRNLQARRERLLY